MADQQKETDDKVTELDSSLYQAQNDISERDMTKKEDDQTIQDLRALIVTKDNKIKDDAKALSSLQAENDKALEVHAAEVKKLND